MSNLLNSIENSKNRPFDRVLFSLGIRYVGETVAAKLARAFKSMDALSLATEQQLLDVEDVGERIAWSVQDFFSDLGNVQMIDRLKAAGLKMELEQQKEIKNILGGKSFIVSGKFSISREELKAKIEEYGGKNVSSISSKTDFLIAGENMGPAKLAKAEKLGISIISEEEFFSRFSGDNID